MCLKFFRNAILIPTFLFHACIPSLSKGFLQSITDFLQFRSLTSSGPSGPFKISFTVSGLLGSGLVVNLNSGSEILTVNADGKYDFSTVLNSGNNFNVSIQTQPTLPTQTCSVSGGSGVVGRGNIDSIIINCDPLRYALSGTITGLDGITGLVLTNSFDGATLNVAVASGTFAFTQTYLDGTSYNVSVTTQPNHPVQNCVTTNGVGVIAGADITNINIVCTSTAFPIEVNVVGLSSGTLTIRNNNSELLTVTTNGTHMFPTDVVINNAYNLQVASQPANHQCVISAPTGVVTVATITVTANCFSMLSVTPSNGGILQSTESIRLKFSAAVNVGSCTGSSGLNTNLGLPAQFSVITTSITDDTLIVSPAPTDSWVNGNSTLTLNCISNSGYPLSTTVNILYLVPSFIRYVSQVNGDDTLMDGLTPLTPKRNIQAAINDFGGCPTFDCAVLVEGGWYYSAAVGDKIQLVDGISLYGGYVAGTNFGTWDPDSHSSQILMITTPASCGGSTQAAPCASVAGDASVVNDTTISGFFIKSGPDTAPYMTGVSLNSTSKVRLINNAIDGGTGISGSSGVHAIDSNPFLVKNLINGGDCTSDSCGALGLYISSAFPISPILLINTISGGTSAYNITKSKGIQFVGPSTITVSNIIGNVFFSKNLNLTSSTESIAFEVTSSASAGSNGTLSGNIFMAGQGYISIGIRIQVASSIEIGSPTQGNSIVSNDGVFTSYGINLLGGHVVRRNAINVGNTTSTGPTTIAGIYITGGGTPILENNAIEVGKANSTVSTSTYGIYTSNSAAAARIVGNYIRTGQSNGTGTATTAAGISISSPSNFLVANNWIQNGTSNYNAFGIELKGMFSGIRIYHNTVSSGSSTVAGRETPIFITTPSSGADIQNNVLLLVDNSAGNACIINSGSGMQSAIKYNVFHNCTSLVYHNSINYTDLCGGGIPTTAGCATPLGVVGNFGNNLNLNPNFVLNFGTVANYTPTTATSCSITKSTNNILTDSFNGNGTRPGGDGAVSLGAIEYEYGCTP
ncbi:hypothetical protein ND861_12300 [Leptospira sp. 2 VSF19]|uniref:Lipoprotein n=1 Tax=Leptospira soteropolitanensis TaxID=2950025 RepID=A0AAW5VET3_9LEPT|nr:hypothetical protein [Leptospira soteropolitanensis]MCW7493420.1 hypothetical protein [Leptospira soteropolitanensis]MCW7501048.1 hypothetical protein [Leptospira soteropolitanensis]MCW7523272.1 hypothetical protein [Leptospira soteropolitanensis]MCW7527133.1 hypothetical protein [Leptospira soteropolitanensis]MCW7530990.1 hypothetical protein [Leptospira soteropolitanensis]